MSWTLKWKRDQLTTSQSNDSRFVTKCRYIVEQQIGILKKNKSLDFIRNTTIGHALIDYKIASAIYNYKFCFKENKTKSRTIVKRMKESREKKNNNYLDFIIRNHLKSSLMDEINLNNIKDFPKLKKSALKDKIYFGTYQLSLANSYLKDLKESAFCLNSKGVSNLQKLLKKNHYIYKNSFNNIIKKKTKLLAIEITSRHQRGSEKHIYKVYIEKGNNF